MDQILTSLSEMIRSLSRISNTNPELVNETDLKRLKNAKQVLRSNTTINENEILIPQNENLPDLPEMAAANFDNIAELASHLWTGNVSHQGRTILGLARRNAEFIRKHYHNDLH